MRGLPSGLPSSAQYSDANANPKNGPKSRVEGKPAVHVEQRGAEATRGDERAAWGLRDEVVVDHEKQIASYALLCNTQSTA